jgi:formylglycine-generating enzyme required for sulfatase activity
MSPFSFGFSLGPRQAAFQHGLRGDDEEPSKTSPVQSFPANAFGLYDMHGNVWEWCSDWFDAEAYRLTQLPDPPGPSQGNFRVVRGGSYRNQASACRSACRHALAPALRLPDVGFRVVMELRT